MNPATAIATLSAITAPAAVYAWTRVEANTSATGASA